jgi:hypothetical protein
MLFPSGAHAGSYKRVFCLDKSFSPEPSALATIRSPSPSLRFLRMNTMKLAATLCAVGFLAVGGHPSVFGIQVLRCCRVYPEQVRAGR